MRIALLGAGAIGHVHAEAYATIPGATVVAVMDREQDAAVRLAANLDAQPYTEIETLLARAQVDVVDCCLPTPLHRRIVERIATARCHVICEKPLAMSVEDGRAMIAACQTAGVHLLVGQVVRFFSPYRLLAVEVQAGRVGRPVTVMLLRQGFYPTGRHNWYRDEAQSGGIFLDLMIHDCDWALQQFGPAERVYARLVRHGLDDVDVERRPFCQGMATVRHHSGVLTQLTATWGHPGPFTTAVEIAGTDGLLQYHMGESQALRLFMPSTDSDAGDVPLPDLSAGENSYRTELAHFIEVISQGAEPVVRPEQALAALELALAARYSAASGRALTMETAVEVTP